MSEVLIRAENVGKKFCRDLKKSLWYGVKDSAADLFQRGHSQASANLRPSEFWANKDVSFELKRGECLGLVGHNGAGKTTLLKILNGLIKPDSGSVSMRGRVGALIALGAGFNPILSGRENIYISASVLGLRKKEIDQKIDEIIDFSEIEEFIDAPVRSYSSGMQVRLGFAVATALTPDILVLDEVLAVGDTSFRHKCYNRINAIMKNCAVVMVSHNMSHIAAVCDVVGFMSKGTFEYHSDKIAGIGAYDAAMNRNSGTRSASDGVVFQVYSPVEHAEIVVRTPEIHYGETLEVDVHLKLSDSIKRLSFSFTAVNEQQQPVMNWNLSRANKPVALEAGESVFRFAIPNLFLHDGNYRCNLWLGEMDSIKANVYAMGVDGFSVKSDCRPISNIPYLPMPNAFEVVRP